MNNTIRSRPFNPNIGKVIHALDGQRGRAFGFMIIGALLASSYSTSAPPSSLSMMYLAI